MKKSLIALSIASFFSINVSAAIAPIVIDIESVDKHLRDNFTVVDSGKTRIVIDDHGNKAIIEDRTVDGGMSSYKVTDANGRKHHVNFDRHGKVFSVNGRKINGKIDDLPDVNGDPTDPINLLKRVKKIESIGKAEIKSVQRQFSAMDSTLRTDAAHALDTVKADGLSHMNTRLAALDDSLRQDGSSALVKAKDQGVEYVTDRISAMDNAVRADAVHALDTVKADGLSHMNTRLAALDDSVRQDGASALAKAKAQGVDLVNTRLNSMNNSLREDGQSAYKSLNTKIDAVAGVDIDGAVDIASDEVNKRITSVGGELAKQGQIAVNAANTRMNSIEERTGRAFSSVRNDAKLAYNNLNTKIDAVAGVDIDGAVDIASDEVNKRITSVGGELAKQGQIAVNAANTRMSNIEARTGQAFSGARKDAELAYNELNKKIDTLTNIDVDGGAEFVSKEVNKRIDIAGEQAYEVAKVEMKNMYAEGKAAIDSAKAEIRKEAVEAYKELQKEIGDSSKNDTFDINDSVASKIAEEFDRIRESGASLASTGEAAYNSLSSDISKNTQAINDLRTDFESQAAQYNERFDKMDKRMDGVMAGTHAINNARPMVSGGQTAFGVGTGFAGKAQAIAVGFAHSFQDSNWSMSATTNVTQGHGIKTELSAGAGVQYAF